MVKKLFGTRRAVLLFTPKKTIEDRLDCKTENHCQNTYVFPTLFPKQGVPIYPTSVPVLSFEKGAPTGCKVPEFPNESSSIGNKTYFATLTNN